LDEAGAFLRDRGMLTRTTDSALPSLYEAFHEEAFKPGSPGFATWPATKWPWFGALAERGYLCLAVHRGMNLLVSHETAALLDPIYRAETDRMRAEKADRRRLLDHLARAGPSNPEDLRLELSLSRQELKALRAPLERCGALVTRPVIMPASDGDGHSHSSELSRWDQAYHGDPHAPHADPQRALGDLVVAAVRAAILVPEPEAHRWFSWQWYWTDTLIADLIHADRLRRIDGHLTARPSMPRQPDEARPSDCPR